MKLHNFELEMTEEQLDKHLRSQDMCRACGGGKDKAGLLCWDCFKHRADITPWKYYRKSLHEWFASLPEPVNHEPTTTHQKGKTKS